MTKILELKNGVKIRVRGVPGQIILAIHERYPEPEVPQWYNEAKQRSEPQPMDPAYIKAVKEHNSLLQQKDNDAYMANGVDVLDLPDGKYPLESDEWIEGLEYVGLEVPRTGIGRKVAWLKYHIVDDSDVGDLITAIAVAGGLVTEDAVEKAAESFRSAEISAADTEPQAPTNLRLWNNPDSDSRDSEPVRVQGDSQVHPENMGTVARPD